MIGLQSLGFRIQALGLRIQSLIGGSGFRVRGQVKKFDNTTR